MIGATLLAVAAVLAQDRIVFVDTHGATVLRTVVLPAPAAALFAAPDGRVVLPLAAVDETALVSQTGPTLRWPGRIFPLFFDEPDRMQVVLPELLLVLSYPERLPILRVPVPGLKEPWRAACSGNGLVVGICAAPAAQRLVLAIAEPGALQQEAVLSGPPLAVVAAPLGDWFAAALEGGVEIVVPGEPRGRGLVPVSGKVRSLALSADGRSVLVGTAAGDRGALVTLRVALRSDRGARVRDEMAISAPVESLAAADDEVVAVAGEKLIVLGKRGKKVLHDLAVPGARQVVLLPERPEAAGPEWTDSAAP